MDGNRISGITFQQFEIFLSAAKHENFTKAAEELHMTPASVSRNIAALETDLGLILFVRHKQRVRLTDAGNHLARKAKELWQKFGIMLDEAYALQKCQYSTLRIGDFNTTSGESYLLPVVERFERKFPDAEISISRVEPLSVYSGLLEDQYDAVFTSSALEEAFEKANMRFVKIFELPPKIVVSNRHRLFKNETISLSELFTDTIVTLSSEKYGAYWRYTREVLESHGFSLKKVKYVDNPHTVAAELWRSDCIALMDELYCPIDRNNLRYIDLPNCKTNLSFGIAFSDANTNPYLKRFVDCGVEAFLAD